MIQQYIIVEVIGFLCIAQQRHPTHAQAKEASERNARFPSAVKVGGITMLSNLFMRGTPQNQLLPLSGTFKRPPPEERGCKRMDPFALLLEEAGKRIDQFARLFWRRPVVCYNMYVHRSMIHVCTLTAVHKSSSSQEQLLHVSPQPSFRQHSGRGQVWPTEPDVCAQCV